ncbi:MAG TPA: FtsQ-type POTRA domain-containing protein [Kiloniellales bacterium]
MRFIGAEDQPYDRRRDRRRPLPIDWRRRARFATAGAGGLAVVGLGWLMVDGWYGRQLAAIGDSLYAASASAGLNVQDVLVEGRARTQREAILATLGLSRGTPILSFDPHAAKERLETLPWVHEATVERRLPDTVYLRLSEREPLALWQYEGKLAVIDRTGQVIAGAPAAAFATLPVVVGEDAPRTAEALLRVLDSEPELRVRVAAAIRVQGRRWNIRLHDGIDIRLPESNAAAAWAELARLQREHEVLQRDVVTIDLRLPDRLVVRTSPGAALTGKRPAGEDT